MNLFKKGDIIVAKWHYSMEFPIFYRVEKATKYSVEIIELEKKVVENIDGYGQVTMEVPTSTTTGTPFRKRVNGYEVRGLCSGHTTGIPWDGQPVYADYCD